MEYETLLSRIYVIKTTMIFANDIKKLILNYLKDNGTKPISPIDVAKSIDPTNWRSVVDQVRIVAETMIKEGQLQDKNYIDRNS